MTDAVCALDTERTRVKICGITRESDVVAAAEAGVDYVGFVLYDKSPRRVSIERARMLAQLLPERITPVLLLVNPDGVDVQAVHDYFTSTELACIVQLHGDETPTACEAVSRNLAQPYWRAARIPVAPDAGGFDLLKYGLDYSGAQALLLDAHAQGYGGSGTSFNWAHFNWSHLKQSVKPHLVLSGGLSLANVADGMAAVRPWAVDVSSGVEVSKGIKDAKKIKSFMAAVREADERVHLAQQPFNPTLPHEQLAGSSDDFSFKPTGAERPF